MPITTNLFDLTGHVALVTGGNSGIGLGMAEGLAAHGATVAIGHQPRQEHRGKAAKPREHGGTVLDLVCDVGDHQAVIDSMKATVDALGRVDSCFVNAGVGGQAPSFVGMTEDEWHRVLRGQPRRRVDTAQEAVKQMVAQGDGGSVVFTTSGSAYFGQQRGQHYGGSKGAVDLDDEGHRRRARPPRHPVQRDPARMDRERHDRRCTRLGQVRREGAARVPLRRWGKPEDFSASAALSASPRASGYQTGDVITVDGGYHSF